MKRILQSIFLLLWAIPAWAQSTSVTLQVTDASAQSWTNGTYSVFLTVPGGVQVPSQFFIASTATIVPNQVQSGTLSGSGGASLTLTPDASIAPAGSIWKFTVCAGITYASPAPPGGPPCFTQSVTIVGASQNVTLTPPTPSFGPGLIFGSGAPPLTWTCSNTTYTDTSTGNTYACKNGIWVAVSAGAGGAGTFSSVNGVIYASQKGGANGGANIQLAVNAAVGNGGKAIADLTGSQTITSQLIIPDGVELKYYAANYTCNISPAAVSISSGNVARAANTVTVTVANSFSAGQFVTLIMASASDKSFNGTWKLATASGSNFTFSQTNPTYGNQTSVGAGNAGLACVVYQAHTHQIGWGTGPTSSNSTTFTAGNGMNAAIMFGQDVSGRSGFLQETSVENIRFEGNAANNTTGYCFEVHQTGEHWRADRLFADGCVNSEFRINGQLAGSASWKELGAFGPTSPAATQVGYDLYDVSSYLKCDSCKGDGNVTHVNIRPASGLGGFTATFNHLSEEANGGGNFVHFDGANSNTFFECHFCSGIGNSVTNAFQVDGGNGPTIEVTDTGFTGYTNLITDNSTGEIINLAAVSNGGFLQHWRYGWAPDIHSTALSVLSAGITLVNGANENILLGPSPNGNHGFIRVTGPSGAFSIGGFVQVTGGPLVDGYQLTLKSNVSQTMTIVNEDVGSTAANRITTLTGSNVVCRTTAPTIVQFIYDATAARWLLETLVC